MVAHGQPVLLDDLVIHADQYKGASVRVVGRLQSYDLQQSQAVLEYKNHQLTLDTELIDISMPLGHLVMCIGEMAETQEIKMKPRVIRHVEALDMELYERTIQLVLAE